MFDLGSMLILFALALMMVSPIHVTVTRPRTNIIQIAPPLRESFAPPASVPHLDEMVRLADDVLADDPLIHATAGIVETYDQA